MTDDLAKVLQARLDALVRTYSNGTGSTQDLLWQRIEATSTLINECRKTKAMERTAGNLRILGESTGRIASALWRRQ